MSTFLKIGLLLGAAAVALGARYLPPLHATSDAQRMSISPMELMRSSRPLPETPVDHYM